MRKTPFAGLTVLNPGESLATDNASFQSQNPVIEDRLLMIGAVTHRHNGAPALGLPTETPGASAVASGGTIAAGTTLYIGFTLLDFQGGETTISPLATVTTEAPIDPPDSPPSAVIDYTAGGLAPDTYYYAISYIDAGGGETPLSDSVSVEREPGYASGRVLLSNLAQGVGTSGIIGWRLWRAQGAGDFFALLTDSSDTYIDDGTACGDPTLTPVADNQNFTNRVSSLQVQVDDPLIASSSAYSIYVSPIADFTGPCLMGTFDPSTAGETITFTNLLASDHRPPDVSTCIPGAHKIDPDTELIDWHWKRPVDTATDLPIGSATSSGDVRITTDTGEAYSFTDGVWHALGLQLTLRDMHGGVEVGSDVELVGSGGADVTVDTDSGRTRVTITASGGADADTDLAIGDVFDAHGNHVPNAHAIQFVGSGGASATVAASGASAIVTVTAPPDVDSGGGGGGSPTLYGAAGNGLGLPTWPPSSPADGDEAEYLADATNGVIWTFRYFAAESGSYKWYFIGGSNLSSEVVTDQSTSSTTFTDLSTVGPSLTLPMAGDFEIGWGMHCWPEASSGNVQGGQMGLSVNGSVASDDYIEVSGYMTTSSPSLSTARVRRKAGLTSGWVVKGQYKTDGAGNLHFGERFLTVRPIRVS